MFAPAVMVVAPWVEVTAPRVSVLLLLWRPEKVTVPPTKLIGTESAMRLVLSMNKLLALLKFSEPP